MDIISFLVGLQKGKSSVKNVDLDEIDDTLDEINGEVIGETLYTVTFAGAEGEFLCEVPTYEGYDCKNPVSIGIIDTPTKESTRYVNYIFAGWSETLGGAASDTVLNEISRNKTVYAAFTEEYIYIKQGRYTDGYNDFGNWIQTVDLTWTLNPDYVLTVTGYGVVPPISVGSGELWDAYRSKITSAIFNVEQKAAMVSIGMHALENCTALSSVSFSEHVSMIEMFVFRGCTSLKTITFPSRMAYIFEGAFTNSGLTTAYFPTTSWGVSDTAGEIDEVLPPEDVANPTTAATYLRETYNNKYWQKITDA